MSQVSHTSTVNQDRIPNSENVEVVLDVTRTPAAKRGTSVGQVEMDLAAQRGATNSPIAWYPSAIPLGE